MFSRCLRNRFLRIDRRCLCGVLVVWVVGGSARLAGKSDPLGSLSDVPLRRARVLLAARATAVRVRSSTKPLRIFTGDTLSSSWPADQWLTIQVGRGHGLDAGDILQTDSRVSVMAEPLEPLSVSIRRNGIWSDPVLYHSVIRMARTDRNRIELVNLLDVEAYVQSVVAGEIWPSFHEEAFRAQAIVARTFVLYHMSHRNARSYDVSATQGAQVYRGVRDDSTSRLAAQATRATRGVVCTFEVDGRPALFCAYYSAVCGGMSQPAPLVAKRQPIAPLAGGVACDYCKIAPGDTYRWGNVRFPEIQVRTRLIETFSEVRTLGRIRAIDVIERTSLGRPKTLRIVGSTGKSYEVPAERFRMAIDGTRIRSTDCKIRLEGREIVFDQGRGFGHGLGLCQWGMQGQALQGREAGQIIRYYFPGAKLTRAY